ncbi:SDR family NAD(P)-dependent oxidoreductase, partial [Streptomyces sp. NPDC002521]
RRTRRLRVSHAFHSPLMEPMLADFEAVARELSYTQPRLPIVSNVTGRLGADLTDPGYWVRQVREAVRFADCVDELAGQGVTLCVEVSADAVLSGLTGDTGAVPSLHRDRPEVRCVVEALGCVHVEGVAVNWAAYFAGSDAHIVDLPVYAFQRRRFWNDEPTAATTPADPSSVDSELWGLVEQAPTAELARQLGVAIADLDRVRPALAGWRGDRRARATVGSWRYRVAWQPLPDSAGAELDGTWLVVAPEGRDTDAIVAVMRERGAVPVVLDIAADDDRAALGGRLRAHTDVVGVLSLAGRDDRPHPLHPELTRGCGATLALVQALGDVGCTAPLWCVTSGAVVVDRHAELTSVAQSALWGLGTGLTLDLPQVWGGLVDLPATPDRTALLRMCEVIAGTTEEQIAIRDNGAFGRRMVRGRTEPDAGAVAPWRPHGTVLITGGTGGLGARVARMLAREGADHLVLVSRSGAAATGAAELEAQLTAAGAAVTFMACDIADRGEVERLLAALPERHEAPLTAVFHTAGASQPITPPYELTVADLAEVAHAKVLGARHLDELLGDRPLEAFVLFSSGSAVWGSAGQAGYASANAWLDGLAHARRARGLTATSFAWGPWDGGMVDARLAERLRRIGTPPLDPDLAVQALSRELAGPETHPVIADFDWLAFVPAYTLARPRPLLNALPEVRAALSESADQAPAATDSDLLARLAGASPEEQQDLLLDLVRGHVTALLGYGDQDELETTRPFSDLGFDSVSAVDLQRRLSAATGRKLPATLVFDHASPDAVASFLRAELLGADAAAGVLPALADIDRLERAVPGLPEDDRSRITGRLRALIARLDGADHSVGTRLEGASAEEVLDFIDKELGLV